MKVKIKRIDPSLELPKYKTSGAVGFDLVSRVDVSIKPKEIVLIPTNNIIETPKGYALILAPRSSSPKRGLSFPHSIGVIDQDFCGPEDELMIQMYNFTDHEVEIKRGERIAQGMFVRVDKLDWEEVETIKNPTRGSFGSTGIN